MTNRPGTGLLSTTLLACMLSTVCTLAQAQTSPASGAPNPTGLVDALNGVFGKQTYGRAIHAKGIVLEGTFTPNPAAASLSKAAHLQATPTPVTVRFSNFAGIPTIADTDGLATPRGMAVKFKLSDGSQTDLVTHSFNGFPSATAEEFRQLMIAVGTSGPGTPAPTPADTFLASHPTAKAFFGNLTPPPVSFATLPYFGVNSFKFTNARGEARFGRYQLVPVAGTHLLPKADIAAAGHDYLGDEIKRRIAAGPVEFLLQVQLSAPGDVIDNPSVAWPDSRPIVKLGTIKIDHVVANSDEAEKVLLFTPTAVTDGIATADPMIEARSAAYSVSYGRRHSSASAAPAGSTTATGHENMLLSEALKNAPGSNITAVVVSYAPGGKSPAHHHAGSVFAYVLEGSVRSQNSATGPVKVYQTGESFFEPAGSVHLVSENASTTKPARLLAVFVAPTSAKLTTPEK